MNIAFRVDASLQIGSGHLMRCLSLADALTARSETIRFVCRNLPDGLAAVVRDRGFELSVLETEDDAAISKSNLSHAHWLAVDQIIDFDQTSVSLRDKQWDCLIIDHYALDVRWETPARQLAKTICVIDDIADREHDCDLLLDQNLHVDGADRYVEHLSGTCKTLLGPRYALLRHEFENARKLTRVRTG